LRELFEVSSTFVTTKFPLGLVTAADGALDPNHAIGDIRHQGMLGIDLQQDSITTLIALGLVGA
jgi:hypothetical protein